LKKTRVLVVDDSAFMRTAVARTLASDERLEVVGQARDGGDAVKRALELSPDVITMDFNMPVMNGAEAVRAILEKRPIPVVMLSAHTYEGAKETVEALSAGAVDFLTKPDGEVSTDLSGIRDELVKKLLSAAAAHPQPAAPAPPPVRKPPPSPIPTPPRTERVSFASMVLDPVVIVAVSTGGPAALERVIPRLPASFPHAVLIVQHMPAQFTRALAERLDSMSALTVREAAGSERPLAGIVLVAPDDRHVVFQRNGTIELKDSPPVNGCRPSADVTLQSAATIYGPRLTALVMTGMGKDGALGASAVRAGGGRVVAQDRDTSVVYGMPRAVIEMGLADDIVPLDRIAAKLVRLAERS
jgi:two-component system chemotaxis response regulator CheB